MLQKQLDLFKAALRTSATNPLTGQIDMGLINIGRSHSSMEKIEHLKKAVKEVMTERKMQSYGYRNLLQHMNQISDMVCLSYVCF